MMMVWKSQGNLAVGIGALFGLFAALLVVYGAWVHNPQGEFHGEEGVAWMELSLIGSVCLVVVGSLVVFVVLSIQHLLRWVARWFV